MAVGGVRYCMEIHRLERPIFYMGDERESRIHERMCKFTVNGTRVGYGISEWCYRSGAWHLQCCILLVVDCLIFELIRDISYFCSALIAILTRI